MEPTVPTVPTAKMANRRLCKELDEFEAIAAAAAAAAAFLVPPRAESRCHEHAAPRLVESLLRMRLGMRLGMGWDVRPSLLAHVHLISRVPCMHPAPYTMHHAPCTHTPHCACR